MKTSWITTLFVITTILTCGCGTVLNLASGDPDVYGGIQKDVKFMMTPRSDANIAVSGGGNGDAYFALLVAADAGLSAIADTLTLPVVIRMRRNERHGDARANVAGADR